MEFGQVNLEKRKIEFGGINPKLFIGFFKGGKYYERN